MNEIQNWSNSGEKVLALKSTPTLLKDLVPDAKSDHVYLDTMCFGMGCSCLQITFQACSIEDGR